MRFNKTLLIESSLIAFFLWAAALTGAQQKKPGIHVTILPGRPIVVAGCKVDSAGGYWRGGGYQEDEFTDWLKAQGGLYSNEVPTDAEFGKFMKQNLRAGLITTLYPDKNGIFATGECQR